MTKRLACAAALLPALILVAAVPAPAMAEGGSSIATAPLIAYGSHEAADTSNGGGGEFHENCDEQSDLNLNSFWQLPVTVGDHITVDWEAVIPKSTCLSVYPSGTNDFGVANAEPEESSEQTSNSKQEMKFVAPASGDLILDFAATKLYSGCTSCAGPYAFTALVQHTLSMSLAAATSVPTNGVVTATVTQNTGTPVPDGLVFWLLGSWYEHGEKESFQGTGTSAGGTVAFQLALPESAANHNLKLLAGRGEDGGYVEAVSNPITMRAELPPTTVAPTRHRRHHRRRHHHRRHHHRHHRHHRRNG
jgi:hypothetical protein